MFYTTFVKTIKISFMKRILSISFCLVLLSIIAKAQTLIPKFGAAVSTISYNQLAADGLDVQNKIGIVGGVGLEFMLGGKMALQPELLFHQKGWKSSITDTDFNMTQQSTVTINYLEIPILVKVKFGSFYVNAGPSVALGLGGKYTLKESGTYNGTFDWNIKFGNTLNTSDYEKVDAVYINNNIDVGLQVGGGYVVANKIMIDLRYGFGLTNIMDKNDLKDNKSKLRSFQVTVGVPIRLGKK